MKKNSSSSFARSVRLLFATLECALSHQEGHSKILLEEAANKSKIQVKSFIDLQKKGAQQKKDKITQLGERG